MRPVEFAASSEPLAARESAMPDTGSLVQRTRSALRAQARLTCVDTARGLLVVCLIVVALAAASPAQPAPLALLAAFLSTFAEPAFFVLAGMFLYRAMRLSWIDFLRVKIAPLVWRYMLWGASGTLLALWLQAPLSAATLMRGFARVLLDPPAMLLVVCALAISLAAVRVLRGLPIIVALPVAAALEIFHVTYGGPIPTAFCRLFVYIYIGHMFAPEIRQFTRYVTQHRGNAVCGLAVWTAMNAIAISIAPPMAAGSVATLPFASLGFGLVGAAAIIAIACLIDGHAGTAILRRAGENALGLYLIGFILIEIWRALAPGLPAQALGAALLCCLGVVVFAIAMARRVVAK